MSDQIVPVPQTHIDYKYNVPGIPHMWSSVRPLVVHFELESAFHRNKLVWCPLILYFALI